MPAATWTIADRKAVEQFIAAKQRLTQFQQIPLAGQPDTQLLAHGAGAAVAADEISRANFLDLAFDAAQARADAVAVLPQGDEFPPKPHPQAGNGFGDRLQQRLERILRDQLIGLERHRPVIAGAGLRPRLLDRRIRKMQ